MELQREIVAVKTLQLEGGRVSPATIGKELGATGINLVSFSKEYNEQTKKETGKCVPVQITIYSDRSFAFVLKTPPTAYLIKEALGIKKGASKAGSEIVGVLTLRQVEEIAKTKLPDMNTSKLNSAMNMVKGTAKQMGVKVEE